MAIKAFFTATKERIKVDISNLKAIETLTYRKAGLFFVECHGLFGFA
jgi:hypothetical protein